MPAYMAKCPVCEREFENYTDVRAARTFCSVGCQFGQDVAPPPPVATVPGTTATERAWLKGCAETHLLRDAPSTSPAWEAVLRLLAERDALERERDEARGLLKATNREWNETITERDAARAQRAQAVNALGRLAAAHETVKFGAIPVDDRTEWIAAYVEASQVLAADRSRSLAPGAEPTETTKEPK